MKCKKCGAELKENEVICLECGYYNDFEEETVFEEFEVEDTKEPNQELLKAYVGEDYQLIKKGFFNIWAFFFNWIYFLYRKLYLTGIIGLIITYFAIVYLKNYVWIYIVICALVLGLCFNKYYLMIVRKRINRWKETKKETDLESLCEKKGGVNTFIALIIYFIFLVIVFIKVMPINIVFNQNHNTKFWKENSENLANCTSVIKAAYQNVEKENIGSAEGAVCKVIKDTKKEYDIYIKTIEDSKVIYSHYTTEEGYLVFKKDTLDLEELQLKKYNNALSDIEKEELKEIEKIETNYQNYYKASLEEEELIKTKKNTKERLHYILTKEEIIR